MQSLKKIHAWAQMKVPLKTEREIERRIRVVIYMFLMLRYFGLMQIQPV